MFVPRAVETRAALSTRRLASSALMHAATDRVGLHSLAAAPLLPGPCALQEGALENNAPGSPLFQLLPNVGEWAAAVACTGLAWAAFASRRGVQ